MDRGGVALGGKERGRREGAYGFFFWMRVWMRDGGGEWGGDGFYGWLRDWLV